MREEKRGEERADEWKEETVGLKESTGMERKEKRNEGEETRREQKSGRRKKVDRRKHRSWENRKVEERRKVKTGVEQKSGVKESMNEVGKSNMTTREELQRKRRRRIHYITKQETKEKVIQTLDSNWID